MPEVAAVDDGDRRTAPGERGGGHRAVDSAADDERVERRVAELLEVPVAERHTEFTIMTVAITLPIPTATGVAYVAHLGKLR